MFENLIESKPKRVRTRSQIVLSGILHVVLGAGAIYATKGAAEQMEKILADTNMVFLKPPEPPPPPPPEPPPPDMVVTANPPPLGFQTVMPPNEIPKEIPPVNLNERFNAADFTGKGVEGGIATGVAGGTGPVTGEAFLAEQVDDPVAPINQPRPRYPPVLQQAGVQGFVEVQFVVDTTGHAESRITVLKSSHPQFEAPAKEAVLKSIFKPARIKGKAVRQLVQQRFGFTIGQ
jgi:protein TonB